MDIITADDLTNHPGVTLTPEQAAWVASEVNDLVTEAWCDPAEPVPSWVRRIAIRAAARFGGNPLNLESWTTSVDDGSVTERTRNSGGPDATGVYLTGSDLIALGCGPVSSAVGTIWTTPSEPPREGLPSW